MGCLMRRGARSSSGWKPPAQRPTGGAPVAGGGLFTLLHLSAAASSLGALCQLERASASRGPAGEGAPLAVNLDGKWTDGGYNPPGEAAALIPDRPPPHCSERTYEQRHWSQPAQVERPEITRRGTKYSTSQDSCGLPAGAARLIHARPLPWPGLSCMRPGLPWTRPPAQGTRAVLQ